MELNELSEIIIGCCFEVYNNLHYGYLEKVYENSLANELKEKKLKMEKQKKLKVFYKGNEVGEYIADLVINNSIIIEIKTAKDINEVFTLQLLNYLKATNLKLGLLVNFGPKKVEIKRVIN